MKTPAYDFILPFFTATDELRPVMTKIHSDDNGFIYATDAHIVIKVPNTSVVNNYENVEKYPNAEKVFTQYEFPYKAIIKTQTLISLLTAYKWLRAYKTENCDKCNGTGSLTCEHCNSDYECENCKGNGKFHKGELDMRLLITKDFFAVVKVINKHFKADFMHVLAVCAKMLDVSDIEVLYNDNEDAPTVFKVADAEILIMPRRAGASDFIKSISVKKQ